MYVVGRCGSVGMHSDDTGGRVRWFQDVVEDELAVVRQVIQGSGVRVIVLTAGLVRHQS